MHGRPGSRAQHTAVTASVLAIGTELTSGQVTNRNAQWLSEQLAAIGFDPVLHETVADNRARILESLAHCARKSDLIFVTGGLGPTTDDFTREVIAEFAKAPLEYDETAWQKIVHRLSERKVEVAESNRTQCWFPHASVVLRNEEGTADGFRLHSGKGFGYGSNQKHLIVLPGPPREARWIWDHHLRPWLRHDFPWVTPDRLLSWKTLGKSEAALGELVEAAVKDLGVRTGYRASAPYVEIKVWVGPNRDEDFVSRVRARVESAIGKWTVARDQEDLLELLFEKLLEKAGTLGITFLDLGSEGYLTDRLLRGLQSQRGEALRHRTEIMTRFHEGSDESQLPPVASEWLFALFPSGAVVALGPEGITKKQLTSPWSSPLLNERRRRYFGERAIEFFLETISRL